MDKHIYFIRHGQAEINLHTENLKYDEMSNPLTELGMKQAEMTGKYINEFHSANTIDIIYSSQYKRALDTANIIKQQINHIILIQIDDDLVEIKTDYDFEIEMNKQYTALIEIYRDPIVGMDIFLHPEKYNLIDLYKKYNVETVDDAIGRIKIFLKKIIDSEHSRIICISHSGIIISMLMYLLNVDIPVIGGKYTITNCGIIYFIVKKSSNEKTQNLRNLDIKFKRIQDTGHFRLYDRVAQN